MSGSIGDNVFRASGVIAAAAAGRTGTVDWDTTPKTSTVTAVNGEGYFCNTSGGAFAVNLPAGVAGSIVAIADYTRTFNTNTCTVTPDGSEKIGGNAASATLTVDGQSATFVYVDATEGWINVQETETSQTGAPPFIQATGGTPSQCGDYEIRTFTGAGTFCVSALSPSAPENAVDWLVVGGGGGGGANDGGGGGGAGGYRESPGTATGCYTVSPRGAAPSAAITVTASPYTIAVGAAGASVESASPGGQGGDSTFSTYTSTGGGGGAQFNACLPAGGPKPGGSGGGGGGRAGSIGSSGGCSSPVTDPVQGTAGGPATPGTSPGSIDSGGGGGGALLAGAAGAPSGPGGAGGGGATSSINATPTARAGGGGGGSEAGTAGTGGSGGGGAGSGPGPGTGTAGGDNTGGGGGGKGTGCGFSGAGGSGVVILRYKYQ